MCGCANRLRSFMQQNGFKKEGAKWVHPEGHEFTEEELSSKHTRIMMNLVKEKVLGRL